MEKGGYGVTLTLFGMLSLVFAVYEFLFHNGAHCNVPVCGSCAILGLIFLSAGIALVRASDQTVNNNEHIS